MCPDTSTSRHDLILEIKSLNEKFSILPILNSLNVTISYTEKHMTQKSINLYYILLLDYDKMSVTIRAFMPSKIDNATKVYDKIEKNPNQNVVLVSAKSFNDLRSAYPNYFADISNFVEKVNNMLK